MGVCMRATLGWGLHNAVASATPAFFKALKGAYIIWMGSWLSACLSTAMIQPWHCPYDGSHKLYGSRQWTPHFLRYVIILFLFVVSYLLPPSHPHPSLRVAVSSFCAQFYSGSSPPSTWMGKKNSSWATGVRPVALYLISCCLLVVQLYKYIRIYIEREKERTNIMSR